MPLITYLQATIPMIIVAGMALAQETPLTPSGDPVPLFAVRLVSPDAVSATSRAFFGRVAARETVDLSFEVGGRLVLFPVTEGVAIEMGSILARLDLAPLERAVELAEINLAQAQRELTRAEALAASNAASQVRVEDAGTVRGRADVALRNARAALENATLYAPFDGIVASRIETHFSNIEPGEPILRLHDMSEVRVEIEVPEQVLTRAGDPSSILFTAQMPDGQSIPLTLAEYEAQTGQVGQSFRVALRLPDEAAVGLIPGMSMTVTAALDAVGNKMALPAGAILATTDRGFEVMVFSADGENTGIVERRDVEVGAPNGLGFAVSGLIVDDRVVAAGAHLLRDGQRVRVYDGLIVEETN